MSEPASRRLLEVDALRGLAALAVLLFHYTTRYRQLFDADASPWLAFPQGFYGVNLFFIVSGFVIFMTLERTRRPMDFVVSRFSRLFPAYWVALWITFAVTSTFGLPGKEVSLGQAVLNMAMLHGLAHVPHVDAVYWTLEVELLFYAGMFMLYLRGGLGRIHAVAAALLVLRLAYYAVSQWWGIDLPWIVYHLLILRYLPWFVLGICIYRQVARAPADGRRADLTLMTLAVAALTVEDGWAVGLLSVALGALVYLAARGRLPWLRHPVLVFFGSISYPLYLVHENIGWVAIRAATHAGLDLNLAIVLAFGLSVALATAVSKGVERPAMGAIRRWYRRQQGPAIA